VRQLSLTAAIASGLTLLALAIAGITALDGRLEASTPGQQLRDTFGVSYPEKPPNACRHRHRIDRQLEDRRAS
jgi:hypothetical protein